MAWELKRVTGTDGNGYDRYTDRYYGSAVVYENVDNRQCWGFINGAYFEVGWPDTSDLFGGDAGRPVGYRIRPEAYQDFDGGWILAGWYLYAYVYSGDENRSEWSIKLR